MYSWSPCPVSRPPSSVVKGETSVVCESTGRGGSVANGKSSGQGQTMDGLRARGTAHSMLILVRVHRREPVLILIPVSCCDQCGSGTNTRRAKWEGTRRRQGMPTLDNEEDERGDGPPYLMCWQACWPINLQAVGQLETSRVSVPVLRRSKVLIPRSKEDYTS